MKSSIKIIIVTIILLVQSFSLMNAQKANNSEREQIKKSIQDYFATYFGGSGTEFCEAIALDEAGNVYVTGYTTSTNFPTVPNSYNSITKGKSDVFILKFDKALKAILASALIGGAGDDAAYSILYDKRGFVYVAGYTGSKDFPTTLSAYSAKYNGGKGDAFVIKMDAQLKTLVASTFIGGSKDEDDFRSPEIVQDKNGNIYVAGITNSEDFPSTKGAFNEKYNGGTMDVFLSKLNPDLSKLLASTLLGGNADDRMGRSLAIDKKTNAVVLAGYTVSLDFPLTKNAYSKKISGELDGFIAQFSPDLSKLTASTMLNGWIYCMFIHENGDIYVGGHGNPTTTPNAYWLVPNQNSDQGFISRFSNDLSKLKSSTLLPGSFHSNGGEITSLNLSQDQNGNIISVGWDSPKNFPTTPGVFDETQNGGSDTYILKIDKDLSKLIASTFIGGSKNERWNRMAIDKNENIYVSSFTSSTDFPTSKGSAFEKFNGGTTDGFIVRINGSLSSEDREEFHNAAKNDNIGLIKQLLSVDNSLLEKTDKYKRTALHSAARYGAGTVVKYLIEKGADITAKDESGNTPLHLAAMYSHDKVIEFLAGKNADINATNIDGQSTMYLASYYGSTNAMGILLSKNADMSIKDKDGNSILHIATLFGNVDKINEILKYNPPINMGNKTGTTPLHLAVRSSNSDKLVEYLIEKGADPAVIDSTGKNALFLTGPFDTKITELLLKKGIKINAKDKEGNTVLHSSLMMINNFRKFDPEVSNRMKDKLKLFIQYGADPTIKNLKGKSPLDIANEIGSKELIELIKGK